MTKETIIEKLKTKYANLGLSDEILGSQADSILANKPTDETIDGIVHGVGVVLKSFQSVLDKTRQQQKQDSSKKDDSKKQNDDENSKKDDDKNSTLEEKFEKLLGTVQQLVTKTATDDKKGNLVKALAAKSIPEKYYNKFLNTVDYGENYSEEETVKAMESEYEDFKQVFATDAAKGGNPPIGTGGNTQKTEVLKDIERLA